MRRTQWDQESTADYLKCMQALFDRLNPPWSLSEQLDYAYRNLLPRLQIVLRRDEFRDFTSLKLLALRIEVGHDAAIHYRAPPVPERSLFPELAYRSPKKAPRGQGVAAAGLSGKANHTKIATNNPHDETAIAEAGSSMSKTDSVPARAVRTPSTTKCWNCEKVGRIARECGEYLRRICCYPCGKPNVAISAYPAVTRMSQDSALTHSQMTFMYDLPSLQYLRIFVGNQPLCLMALVVSGSS
ncbi:hypothetical protein ALC62_03774 [Cyphomyrmex costatus]|uniref:CCHC-type domain-containing protein n=1 Tax=Cyphomyrmex costatus TaxID=456900 RepID=A0A151IL27_9HYME|nr:hypothetical protein ALC62_03774 [Cyphomyrmex costatus]